jgi:hypothetical protein
MNFKKAKSMGNIMSAAFGFITRNFKNATVLRFDFSFLKSIYYY